MNIMRYMQEPLDKNPLCSMKEDWVGGEWWVSGLEEAPLKIVSSLPNDINFNGILKIKYSFFFDTGSCYVVVADLELAM